MAQLPDPSVTDFAGIRRNFDALRKRTDQDDARLTAALGNVDAFEGPFDTGVSIAIAPQTDVALTVAHNLGLAGTQTLVGYLYDGSFAGFCTWRGSIDGANQFRIFVANLRAAGNSQAGWRGYIILS